MVCHRMLWIIRELGCKLIEQYLGPSKGYNVLAINKPDNF